MGLVNHQDRATLSLNTIDYAHHEVHSGSSYFIKSASDLGNGDVIQAFVTTPDTTKWAHVIPVFDTESQYNYWIYETVTINSAGVVMTPCNRDRNSSNLSAFVTSIAIDADIINANTSCTVDVASASSGALYTGMTGSGKQRGGGTRGIEELILKQNTAYCFRLECVSAGWADFYINWYEHTNKS